jgi:predicted RNase H-like HicB family nuclease
VITSLQNAARGTMKLTAIFKKVRGGYVGFVEELPGANTQGRTLAETRTNLKEAVSLVLEANRSLEESAGRE